jgi:hypothetical protein
MTFSVLILLAVEGKELKFTQPSWNITRVESVHKSEEALQEEVSEFAPIIDSPVQAKL